LELEYYSHGQKVLGVPTALVCISKLLITPEKLYGCEITKKEFTFFAA